MSQTAMVLASEFGGTVDEWRDKLKTLLQGDVAPSLDLLTRIDAILSGPSKVRPQDASQVLLF